MYMTLLLSLPDCYLRLALVFADMGGGLLVVYLMQTLTPHACFLGTVQERWAMIRRILFALVAYALFTRGVWRINKPAPVDWIEFHTQILIIAGLVTFAVMRAMGWISQDELREKR